MTESFDTTPPPQPAPSRWSGMGARIASALLLAVFFLGALVAGGWVFTWLILLSALIMMREWTGLTEKDGALWRSLGLLYVSIPCASLIWLRNAPSGLQLVLYAILVVWATDIGAYFAGRAIGGPKLAPVISPNKTWAGLGGGVVSAAVVGGICATFTPYPAHWFFCATLAALFAVVSQSGDLFESWLKRTAGVKDSSSLIPGHGGLLDRVDGLIPVLPLFALLVYFSGHIG